MRKGAAQRKARTSSRKATLRGGCAPVGTTSPGTVVRCCCRPAENCTLCRKHNKTTELLPFGRSGGFFLFLPHAKPELITKLTDSTRRAGCPRGKTSRSPAPNSFPRAQGLNGKSLVTIKRWRKIKESAPSSRRRVCFPFPQREEESDNYLRPLHGGASTSLAEFNHNRPILRGASDHTLTHSHTHTISRVEVIYDSRFMSFAIIKTLLFTIPERPFELEGRCIRPFACRC